MTKRLALFALLCLVSLSAGPVAPCKSSARIIKGPNSLRQYLLRIEIPPNCYNEGRLARIITGRGGKLPPWGYFKLGDGAPIYVNYWVFKGASVEDRQAPNVWVKVPIKGSSW